MDDPTCCSRFAALWLPRSDVRRPVCQPLIICTNYPTNQQKNQLTNQQKKQLSNQPANYLTNPQPNKLINQQQATS